MQEERQIVFDPFNLDVANERLCRGREEIRLHPKAFSVLRCLTKHSGRLVTKDALLEKVWPEVHVTDAVLTESIREIRKALGDNPKKPRFIETVHRRGYRFIGSVNTNQPTLRQVLSQASPPSRVRETLRKPPVAKVASTIGALPLVGRENELAFLQARLDLALDGNGGAVFITGQAGIGKTRLAREVLRYAQGKGCQWLEGKYDKAVSQPYKAWGDAVRNYLQQEGGALLQRVEGPYATHLAKIVPEMEDLLEDDSTTVTRDPESERFRLFEGLTQFFIQRSREVPHVLFLDDLQWATSIELLHYLSQRIGDQRLLILGAYRDDELKQNSSVWGTLLAMNRERLFDPLPLHSLEQNAMGQLLSQRVKGETDSQLVEAIYNKSEGNPFFAEEMLRLLQERKAIVQTEAGWRLRETASLEIPDSVKAIINEHLERLGNDAGRFLRMACVIGREFPLPLLKGLVDQDEEAVVKVLDRCEAAGLVVSRQILGEETYNFTHDLLQESLYESIGPAQRRRHHLRTGQVVEKLYGARLKDQYDALAHHFLEGSDIGKAAEYSVKGGERAIQTSSWERAVRHFETALGLLEKLPEDLARKAQVLERLADLQNLLGRRNLDYIEKALELYTQLGDERKAARMHELVARAWSSGTAGQVVDNVKALAHCESAVTLLEAAPDSAEKQGGYSVFSFMLSNLFELERALQQGRKALEMAERLKDSDGVSTACLYLSIALAVRGELNEADQYVGRCWQTSLHGRDTWARGRITVVPIVFWPWRNDKAWLEQWLKRALDYKKQSLVERFDLHIYGLLGLLSALTGSPIEATEALRRAEEAAARRPYFTPFFLYFAGAAHTILGDWERAGQLLNKASEAAEIGHHLSHTVSACIYYGRFLLASGDITKAEDTIVKGYTLAHDKHSTIQELNLLPLLCELHIRTRRLEEAERDLRRAQEILARPQPWRGLAAPVHLVEGLLASAKGAWAKAEKAFRSAQDAERTYGFPYGEARVLFEWGNMCVKRNAPGDRERGRELLGQALEIYKRCAAKKDIEKVETALARL